MVVQLLLTGSVLTKLGLGPALYVTPGALFAGSLALMGLPGLVTSTLTRMTDAVLRNSVHRSAMEVIYMNLPSNVVKAVKTFLDVVVERAGDAAAGFIILVFTLSPVETYLSYIHFICIVMILVWLALNFYLRAAAEEGIEAITDVRARRSWLERETGE